jgi:uncharacterized protein YjiS (DUF1127 family)
MPDKHNKPRLRDRLSLANLKHLFSQQQRPSLRHISDAQARDIGLSPAQMAIVRFEYPSRTITHRGL